jgi:hypothetical protein
MLKKVGLALFLLFFFTLFGLTAAKVSHSSIKSPAAQSTSLVAPSQQETLDQAYDRGYNDGMSSIKQSYDLMLKRPTYSQVLDFLSSDNTSQMQSGNCLDFSTRFRDNALARGLWSYVVILNWQSGTGLHGWHALNAFDTTDKGLVYIEPSGDKIVTLKLGDDYSKVFCSIGKFCPLEPMLVIQIGLVR